MCLGVPGKVVLVNDEWNATVDVNGVQRVVNISYISDEERQTLHDKWVLIHVGFAMSIIDEQDALASLKLLAQLTDGSNDSVSLEPTAKGATL